MLRRARNGKGSRRAVVTEAGAVVAESTRHSRYSPRAASPHPPITSHRTGATSRAALGSGHNVRNRRAQSAHVIRSAGRARRRRGSSPACPCGCAWFRTSPPRPRRQRVALPALCLRCRQRARFSACPLMPSTVRSGTLSALLRWATASAPAVPLCSFGAAPFITPAN